MSFMHLNNSLFSDHTIASSMSRVHSRRTQIINQHCHIWVHQPTRHQLGIYPFFIAKLINNTVYPCSFPVLYCFFTSAAPLSVYAGESSGFGPRWLTRDPEIVYGVTLFRRWAWSTDKASGSGGRRSRLGGRGSVAGNVNLASVRN